LIGAIIGDIIGSRFEFNNHRSKNFELFTDECQVTDDSIMTLAVAKAIMETEKKIKPLLNKHDNNYDYHILLETMTIKYMQEIGRKYPYCGYGGMFGSWIFSNNPEPYNSFGNGAAMRISPVGIIAHTDYEACELSEIVTSITHNHTEGIKGAEATAVAIFMAKRGFSKEEIFHKINKSYYNLDFTIDEIRDTYKFNETCQETVPQAIVAFLESISFEDAIRTAVSVGGDSDTLAAITGSIAEAYYGVPKDIKEKALTYLDAELRSIYDEWCEFMGGESEPGKFKVLTKYIGKLNLDNEQLCGQWIYFGEENGESNEPYELPYVNYKELVDSFVREFNEFSDNHPEYQLLDYCSILNNYGVKWNKKSMKKANLELLDDKCILALIMGAIQAETISKMSFLNFLDDGSIIKWLKRLKNIDDSNLAPVTEIYFSVGGYFGGSDTYYLNIENNNATLTTTKGYGLSPIEKQYSEEETKLLLDNFEALHVEYWNYEYVDPFICDGTQWELAVRCEGKRAVVWRGSNDYPENWDDLLLFFGIEEEDEYDEDDNDGYK
jgi:ADP-ribosylglycohydrolase